VKLNEAKRRCGKRGWRRFGGTRGADGEIDDVYSRSGGDGGGWPVQPILRRLMHLRHVEELVR
jgi:hypothetical protein